MDLIQYKPDVLSNELYQSSKDYHESKVLLNKYERDRKRTIAQEYLKQRALGKTGKDAEMAALASVKIMDIDTKITLSDTDTKDKFAKYEAKLVEIDLIRSYNSTAKEELKLAQINENVIRKSAYEQNR